MKRSLRSREEIEATHYFKAPGLTSTSSVESQSRGFLVRCRDAPTHASIAARYDARVAHRPASPAARRRPARVQTRGRKTRNARRNQSKGTSAIADGSRGPAGHQRKKR